MSVRINGHGVHGMIPQPLKQSAKIRTPCHAHVLNGSGGRSGHTRRQAHGAAVGNKDPVHTGQISCSEDRPKILGIFHPVQRKQKRRHRLLRHMRKDRLF